MNRACPRCGHAIRPAARFCGGCGLALIYLGEKVESAVRLPHPAPLAAPEGFRPCEDAPSLMVAMRHAWGGEALLDTEPCVVHVFNAGYDLRDVKLRIAGMDEAGREAFVVEREIASLPRGHEEVLELASWELAPAKRLAVRLVGASFTPAE